MTLGPRATRSSWQRAQRDEQALLPPPIFSAPAMAVPGTRLFPQGPAVRPPSQKRHTRARFGGLLLPKDAAERAPARPGVTQAPGVAVSAAQTSLRSCEADCDATINRQLERVRRRDQQIREMRLTVC